MDYRTSAIRRTPPGVRELKPILWRVWLDAQSRTPPGVRELKRDPRDSPYRSDWSHPSRGA